MRNPAFLLGQYNCHQFSSLLIDTGAEKMSAALNFCGVCVGSITEWLSQVDSQFLFLLVHEYHCSKKFGQVSIFFF